MDNKEIIEIVRNLLDGVKELNGEFQEGWDEEVKKGIKLIKHLEKVKFSLSDVSLDEQGETAVCRNEGCDSTEIVEFLGRNKRQCQLCGEFWKTGN